MPPAAAGKSAAGEALNASHVRRSRNGPEERKRLRSVETSAVSEDSISRSQNRRHAASVHPGALVPHWFAGAVNPLTAQLAALTARIDNERLHRKNRHAFHAAVAMVDDDAMGLSQVMKTIAGIGPGLPGLLPIPAPVLVSPVGALPGPPFPADIGAMRALTALQLNRLSVFFNDSFGILDDDALDIQRRKFKAFICGA
jgi:hypothetical protein